MTGAIEGVNYFNLHSDPIRQNYYCPCFIEERTEQVSDRLRSYKWEKQEWDPDGLMLDCVPITTMQYCLLQSNPKRRKAVCVGRCSRLQEYPDT